MAPSGPMENRFRPRFPAQIPDHEAALMWRTHLSEGRGRSCHFPECIESRASRRYNFVTLHEKIRLEPASGRADVCL